jgi:large subunit ribosomal protein L10
LATPRKIDRVTVLKEKLEGCTIALTADYTGISVNEMVDLRRRMRAAGVEFTVVKNTLMELAADAAQRPQVKEIVQGPTVVAFGYDDPLEVAKAIAEYTRTVRSTLAVRGAVLENGPALPPVDVNRLATLPGKPQLVANLMGQLQSPIQRLAGVLNGPLQNLGSLLQARVNQLESVESGS